MANSKYYILTYYYKPLEWKIIIKSNVVKFKKFLIYYMSLFDLVSNEEKIESKINTNVLINKINDKIELNINNRIVTIELKQRNYRYGLFMYFFEFILDDFENKCNYLLLHGASFVNEKKESIIFLGKTMSGKSTLAYNLSEKGYKFNTDDVVVIDCQNMTVIPFPKPIFLRKIEHVEMDNFKRDEMKKYRIGTGKFKKFVCLPNNFSKEEHKIKEIYLYKYSQNKKIEKISRKDGYIILLSNMLLGKQIPSYIKNILELSKQINIFELNNNNIEEVLEIMN